MDFTIVLKPAWVYLILIFCSVQRSDQTSQNGIEESIKNLHIVILGKWEDLEYKFSSIDDRLRKVDVLIKNDIKPKLESMEVKVKKIEIEVTTIGLSSNSQSPSEISACGQSPSLDIDNALEGPINELKSQGNSIHAAINTLTSNTLSMSTKMDNIGIEIKNGINSIQLPFEQLNQLSKSYSSGVENLTSQISSDIKEDFALVTDQLTTLKAQANTTLHEIRLVKEDCPIPNEISSQISSDIKEDFALVTDQLTALKRQANTTLHEIRLVKEDYPTKNEISSQIHTIEANLNKSDEIIRLLECKPVSGITVASLPWHTVGSRGSDKFVRFADSVDRLTWENARRLCKNNCMDLYQPKDTVEVAKYLNRKFMENFYWIAGRGDGSRQVWVTTGEAVNKTEPWYASAYTEVGNDLCLGLRTFGGQPEARTILSTSLCIYNYPVLCG